MLTGRPLIFLQDEEGPEAEELEKLVQLDGAPAAAPAPYQGPVFPPQLCSAAPDQAQTPLVAFSPQLVNQLVDW